MGKKPDYEKLKKLWYKKLTKSGFEDIEYEDGSMESSAPAALRPGANNRHLNYELVRDYYLMATQFLHSHQFQVPLHKVIWEYHTEGLSIREISATLKKARVKKISKTKVGTIIQEYTNIMKRSYLSL